MSAGLFAMLLGLVLLVAGVPLVTGYFGFVHHEPLRASTLC
ncbi:hypothetical protein [Sphingomonas sp. Marseille-Q8236]